MENNKYSNYQTCILDRNRVLSCNENEKAEVLKMLHCRLVSGSTKEGRYIDIWQLFQEKAGFWIRLQKLPHAIKLCMVKLFFVDILPDCDALICIMTRNGILLHCTNQQNYITEAVQWYINLFKNFIWNLLPVAILSRRISINKCQHALIENSYSL